MAAPTVPTSPTERPRAAIPQRTLRTDRWWQAPAISALVLLAFVVYATITAFYNRDYYYAPYLSPFYSPCLVAGCHLASNGYLHGARVNVPHLTILGYWWAVSPALLILIFPLGFRMTCYYYRRTYYRAFWQSPPACAVAEPHARYTGETRFPLILQNIHRYFFYFGLIFNAILTYDAVLAFKSHNGSWGHVGVGTVVMVINAVLLWLYSASCHSCRHLVGGRLKHFSKHPIRFKLWGVVSKLNAKHMQLAWTSLIWVALTDLYIRLAASGTLGHGGWI
jgi:hypothetical protein